MDLDSNPFIAFSFIVAPAVLTNASSILTLSTSNRLARAVDQTRDITTELERQEVLQTLYAEGRLKELTSYQRRMVMLTRALGAFYVALSGFATTTMLALLGAILSTFVPAGVAQALAVAAVIILGVAVVSMAHGALMLALETRIAIGVLNDRAVRLGQGIAGRPGSADLPRRSYTDAETEL
ncbi:DUF2721 domain-containing protein [Limnoglobus roseus]|uniref:DUF2721 domain-containing protein n=1 Tax=Limnoglobus roseus TaxID=2598579 RepID=A0A5C1ACI8_9BACT|nr:DUF2721 domain-containing protein [Limnoglobus roseus]QEL15696.1 hypothetical protein PX52LOC_02631 [Limnoglobus roseus]